MYLILILHYFNKMHFLLILLDWLFLAQLINFLNEDGKFILQIKMLWWQYFVWLYDKIYGPRPTKTFKYNIRRPVPREYKMYSHIFWRMLYVTIFFIGLYGYGVYVFFDFILIKDPWCGRWFLKLLYLFFILLWIYSMNSRTKQHKNEPTQY